MGRDLSGTELRKRLILQRGANCSIGLRRGHFRAIAWHPDPERPTGQFNVLNVLLSRLGGSLKSSGRSTEGGVPVCPSAFTWMRRRLTEADAWPTITRGKSPSVYRRFRRAIDCSDWKTASLGNWPQAIAGLDRRRSSARDPGLCFWHVDPSAGRAQRPRISYRYGDLTLTFGGPRLHRAARQPLSALCAFFRHMRRRRNRRSALTGFAGERKIRPLVTRRIGG